MASSAVVRAWAADNNEELRDRGRIPAGVAERFNLAHPDDPYRHEERSGGNGSRADYPDDDFESAFADPPDSSSDVAEKAPRRPPRDRAPKQRGGWFRRRAGGKGKKAPRVTTEPVIGAVWRAAAGIFKPVPSVNRILRVQAPIAGMLLDDTVKETALDVVLQPLARLAGGGKAITALAGPPVFLAMIESMRYQQARTGQPPNAVMAMAAQEGLRQSLMAMLDVAGPKFDRVRQQEEEREERYGQSVDKMIEWLLSAPMAPDAEEEAIRRVQGFRAGDEEFTAAA